MKIVLVVLFFARLLAAPLQVSAHGGLARLDLDVMRASPGATLNLRGSGFEQDGTITLWLIGMDKIYLGTVTADFDGDLVTTVILPTDAGYGVYELRGIDIHHVAAVPLTIFPDVQEVQGVQREIEEPLLAPMPTHAPGAKALNAPNSSGDKAPFAKNEYAASMPGVLLIFTTVGLFILCFGFFFIARRFREDQDKA